MLTGPAKSLSLAPRHRLVMETLSLSLKSEACTIVTSDEPHRSDLNVGI